MTNPVAIQQSTENKLRFVKNLYDEYSVGAEHQISVHEIASRYNIPYASVNKAIVALEKSGAISRRSDYASGGTRGRRAFMTLNVPKEDAINVVKEDTETPVDSSSLKQKILFALSATAKPLSCRELAYAINIRNADKSSGPDFHNMTHVLHSLQRQGKVAFHTDQTKDKVPYDIRLIGKPKDVEKFSPVETIAPEISPAPESIAAASPVIEDEPEVVVNRFPLAEKLAARKEWLAQAAKLAESAGEEDIAITLMERVEKPFSAIEQEHIDLYHAFMDCVKS